MERRAHFPDMFFFSLTRQRQRSSLNQDFLAALPLGLYAVLVTGTSYRDCKQVQV